MQRPLFSCVVFALIASVLAVQAQAPLFTAETRMIVLPVTVLNARGEPVGTLDRDAFKVFEDGRGQSIVQFSRDDQPVSLGLIVDNSGSMRALREQVERAAMALVQASNPEDETLVVNFADTPRLDVPLTRDRAALARGIAGAEPIGGTALRDAIALGAQEVARGRYERRVLVVITDGRDTASVAQSDVVRDLARTKGILIYAIALSAAADRHDLERIAGPTGGVVYAPAAVEQIDAIALNIAREIRTQYLIGYVPSNPALDGAYRRITVSVSGSRGLRARTRDGYVASRRAD